MLQILFYNFKRGRLWIGGILRQAEINAGAAAPHLSDEAINWGVQVAGAFKVTKRLRAGFAAQVGQGFQGYMGTAVPGNVEALTFLAGTATSVSLKPVFGWGAYGWVRWAWTDTLRSTFMYSYFLNDALGASGPVILGVPAKLFFIGRIHWAQSVHANLIWSPVPAVNIGIEYIFSHAGIYGFADATYHAVQISFQYKF